MNSSQSSKSQKIVYITGCLGFIGSHITRRCLQRGWHVKGVDKITYAANLEFLGEFKAFENFSFLETDINDLKFLYECDYLINTAAETHVGNSIISSKDFIKSNIDGVHNLLELIRNYRIENLKKPTLLHVSTDEVYGDIADGEHAEDNLLRPSNPYSATKAAADMLVLAWGRTHSIPYVIVRPTNNYGIGQYVEKLIPKACKYLKINKKIPLHNGGKPIRNWLHADDTARAIIALIEKGCKNDIYNISGPSEQSNYETCKKIINLFDSTLEVDECLDFSYDRTGQDIRYALDDSKLQNIGWSPLKKFDEELPAIVEYYKERFIW